MAPRETPKATTKVQRTIKDLPTKGRSSPIGAIKKTSLIKKTVDKTPYKINNEHGNNGTNETRVTRQRTSTVPQLATPKPKDNKSVPAPSNVTKSVKKVSTWKRRPKPAHSGVPIPEKMRKLMEKQFSDPEYAL